MNNNLISIKEIEIKEDFELEKENEEILLNICKNRHINIDYKEKLISQELNKRLLPDYKYKFDVCNLKKICKDIDDGIMKYALDNASKAKYDEDFFNIIKEIEKLKCDKKLLDFTYFWSHKAKLQLKCFDSEETDDLLSCLCNDNLKSQLEFLKAFKDRESLNMLNDCMNMCNGNDDKMFRIFLKIMVFYQS